MADGANGIYASLEEKWYNLLDKVNGAGIPIYKLIDPIDNVVPSFALFLGIAALLVLGGIALLFLSSPPQGTADLTVMVEDEQGRAVKGVNVEISGPAGIMLDRKTANNGEALFEDLPAGEYTLSAGKDGYDDADRKISIGTEDLSETIVIYKTTEPPLPPGEEEDVTLTFVGPDGKKVVGTTLWLNIACSSGVKPRKRSYSTDTGEVVVSVPADCGKILVDVSGGNFKSRQYTTTGGIIPLEVREVDEGTIEIDIVALDTEGIEIDLDGIKVSVFDSYGSRVDLGYSAFGMISFSLPPGEYTAALEDEELKYATERIEFNIEPDYTTTEKVVMSEIIGARIEITVKASESGGIIEGARVFLKRGDEGTLEKETDPGGIAVFPLAIGDSGKYYVSAAAEGYIASDEIEIDVTDAEPEDVFAEEIGLDKCTPSTCGQVKVRVIDEDMLYVENAVVTLFDADSGFRADEYGSRATDINGTVEFEGVKKGEYYALAQKYPASAESDVFEADPDGGTAEVLVELVIGNGTLRVEVVDIDDEAIPFADVEIVSEGGEGLGVIPTDARGVLEREFKADKSIYVVVSKEGYTTYTSVPEQVYPDTTIRIVAQLEEEILGEMAEVKLLGIYSGNDEVENLTAGEKYTIKMQLRVPTEQDFSEMGLHVRTGQTGDVKKDNIYINDVSAPYSAVLRGSTYDVENFGNENVTNGDAKWANIVWDDDFIEPGIYNIEIEVRVRAETTLGHLLPFYYRAWSVSEGEYLRDPADERLGTAAETADLAGLYAETYGKNYFEGSPEMCDDEFCYSEKVIDVTEGLNLTDTPYNLRVTDEYKWMFTITNNSETIHDEANIRIKNANGSRTDNVVRIEDYKITNADGKIISGSTPAFELEPIDTGYLSWNKSIKGDEFTLVGRKMEESDIEIKIVSSGNVVFERLIPFSVYSETDTRLSVEPEVLPSFSPTKLEVVAEYLDNEEEWQFLDDALITVTRIAPDKSTSSESDYTNGKGEVDLMLPALSPGTRIKVRLEKPGYATQEIEKKVTADIISFDPELLSAELDLTDIWEDFQELAITSLITKGLTVNKMKVTGMFAGLLDVSTMQNYLDEQAGDVIIEGMETESVEFESALNEEVARLLDRSQTVEGELVIDFRDESGIGTWSFGVPFEVAISLGSGPAEAGCLTVSQKEWKDVIFDGAASTSFTVTNGCMDEKGRAIALRNLKARLLWDSDTIGQVKIVGTNLESGESSPVEVLQESHYAVMFAEVPPGSQHEFVVTFTPKPGVKKGSVAEFAIEIDAEAMTSGGLDEVGSSNDIDSSITIANIRECVVLDPHPAEGVKAQIDDDSREIGEFTITHECGDIDIDFRLCYKDNKCRGGTAEGGIELSRDDIDNVKEGEEEKIIIESAEMAGMYGVKIEARPEGASWREVAVMEVEVKPRWSQPIDMEAYDFEIIGEGAVDSTKLWNYWLEETIVVEADLCAWGEASKNGFMMGESVGGGLAAGGLVAASLVASTLIFIEAATLATIWWGPVGWIAGAAAILTYIALSLILKEDCHDKTDTAPFNDFIINLSGKEGKYSLPPDALAIMLSGRNKIGARYNLVGDEIRTGNVWEAKQYIGAVFENSGAADSEPVYDIMTARVKLHGHGQSMHSGKANVYCDEGDFGAYWIGYAGNQGDCSPAWDETKDYKFHLKFTTAEVSEPLPEKDFDTFSCEGTSGELGRTGPGAVPRVKLNWGWIEPRGIAYNECDMDNEDYVYCDATQFSIAVSKKLKQLHEFLEANGFNLDNENGCATWGQSSYDGLAERNTETGTHDVDNGKIGLSEITASVSGYDVEATVKVSNKTQQMQNAKVNIYLQGTNYSDDCELNILDIGKGAVKSDSCVFEDLDAGTYAVLAEMGASSAKDEEIDESTVSYGFVISDTSTGGNTNCLGKTTETYYGVPLIVKFVEQKNDVKWTGAVGSIADLKGLLKFNAYLMKDGYTEDFREDFVEHYTNIEFMDTPPYFTDIGLDRLFTEGRILFTERFINDTETQLSGPGLYEVEIAAYFEDDWRFFKPAVGDKPPEPNTAIAVVLYKLDAPKYNSPFYYMPFDGHVGLIGETYDRQGYGTGYFNFSPEDMLQINNEASAVKMYPSTGSNPIATTDTEVVTDFMSLNTDPETRGALLILDRTGEEPKITLLPSRATPVMMKYSRAEKTDEPFSAFYMVTESSTPLSTGSVMNYWDGAGNCYDYTGVPVWSAFYQNPDRAGTQEDVAGDWLHSYAIDWDEAVYSGNVFLRTIFYTNPAGDTSIVAEYPKGNIMFYTPDRDGQTVVIQGIQDMPYNSPGGGSYNSISSLQDVFSMVKDQDVCVTNSGTKVKFWWNPAIIYKTKGAMNRSIHEMTEALSADSPREELQCIGYAN